MGVVNTRYSIQSQRANATVDYVANSVHLVHIFISKMPGYLSIVWHTSLNRQSLELEETTNFIEVGWL